MTSWIPFLYKSSNKNKGNAIEVFEKELKLISLNISKLTEKSNQIIKSQKTVKFHSIIYFIACYLVYLFYLFVLCSGKLEPHDSLGLVISPILFRLYLFALKSIYNRRINSLSIKIENLKQDHADKIDELKELTNFAKTKDILRKFNEEGEDLEELAKKNQQEYFENLQLNNVIPNQAQLPQRGQNNFSLMDKLMQFIIGEDELSPNQRYALICSKCFQHNGLAPPSRIPKYVKYRCPNCGELNGEDDPILVNEGGKEETEIDVAEQELKETKDNENEKVPVNIVDNEGDSSSGSGANKYNENSAASITKR
ncbi:hypothetical protein PACTADRAFT_50369 [Pachysolen tannophilus NRRL Y-2460]|uniref:Endoplasmic reticulum junction formation protein lunapark n=1 Tax=Pachysolen tannophilus NRRL Y-2460 TaxID=669874 RepID=A0A1E4TVB2_PACTA|nr:hypothetical protein PACTADRAFT_50369 [Pachysolen tannophilus NRRL Y-2460]